MGSGGCGITETRHDMLLSCWNIFSDVLECTWIFLSPVIIQVRVVFRKTVVGD